MKILILLTFILSFSSINVIAQPAPTKNKGDTFKFFRAEKTLIKNPFELRDPFKRKTIKLQSRAKILRGNKVVFSNVPSIQNIPIENIRIIGVFLGSQRRAVAKILESDKLSEESYMLKEGMKLGLNNAELKAILPGGVVLVEKIRNVYDQDEYLETIIPVYNQ